MLLMLLGHLFDRFVAQSPVSVMVRGTLEYALQPQQLDELFARHAQHQYTRELLFSSVVDLLSLVVSGTHTSVHAAYQASPQELAVSLTSVYNKLNGLETHLSAELVRYTTRQLEPVLRQLGGVLPALVPGYRVQILDGNHLAATEHRLAETRGQSAAPLPGLALVVLDPALMLVTDVFPCENGHTQERALLGDVLATIRARDLWVADRNFCVQDFLLGIAAKSGCFIIREHKGLTWQTAGKLRSRGRIEGARVREQRVSILDADGHKVFLRRVVLQLDKPTRDGEYELALLSNLPVDEATAQTIGQVYRKRWTIETAFQELTAVLCCEVNTLCYPRAALFAFCVALVAYNVLGIVKGALRAVHGADKINHEVSGYHLASEIAGMKEGMMVALPAEDWQVFRTLTAEQLVELLRELAGKVRLARFRKAHRGPKKPAVKRKYNKKHPHVATAKLLAERQRKKQSRI
jgi:ribosomal protein L29